jgi:hypothetical protein
MVERYQSPSSMPAPAPTSTSLPPGARCVHHPDREAERACGRCGAFVCGSCLVAGELCAECKRRLLKEGIQWTPREKARASARRLRERSELALRIEMGVAVVGLLLSAGASSGFVPSFLARLGLGVWGVACVLGLAVVAGALVGYARSEQGRPGPAVQGVYSRGHALLVGGLGALPALISLASLLT